MHVGSCTGFAYIIMFCIEICICFSFGTRPTECSQSNAGSPFFSPCDRAIYLNFMLDMHVQVISYRDYIAQRKWCKNPAISQNIYFPTILYSCTNCTRWLSNLPRQNWCSITLTMRYICDSGIISETTRSVKVWYFLEIPSQGLMIKSIYGIICKLKGAGTKQSFDPPSVVQKYKEHLVSCRIFFQS